MLDEAKVKVKIKRVRFSQQKNIHVGRVFVCYWCCQKGIKSQ